MASKEKPTNSFSDAITLLMDDHKRVKGLFEEFQMFQEADQDGYAALKQELINATCNELIIHTTIEEELFYPAAHKALSDGDDLLNEAMVEHAGAKDLIAQIKAGNASDPMTCARFKVLGEQIDHHLREEETEMFPKLRKSKMDLKGLGRKMAARQEQLKSEMGVTPYDEESDDPQTGDKQPSLWDRLRNAAGLSGQGSIYR